MVVLCTSWYRLVFVPLQICGILCPFSNTESKAKGEYADRVGHTLHAFLLRVANPQLKVAKLLQYWVVDQSTFTAIGRETGGVSPGFCVTHFCQYSRSKLSALSTFFAGSHVSWRSLNPFHLIRY